ncbi:MAG: hypothetical protein FJX56_09055 [Alphaproteobacteria bacterium]|nr:hypothetical protein [Alphaproteobacteria bacterium]
MISDATTTITLILVAIIGGVFLLVVAYHSLRCAAWLLEWAGEQGFVGIYSYVALWVFLFPVMLTVCLVVGTVLAIVGSFQWIGRIPKGVSELISPVARAEVTTDGERMLRPFQKEQNAQEERRAEARLVHEEHEDAQRWRECETLWKQESEQRAQWTERRRLRTRGLPRNLRKRLALRYETDELQLIGEIRNMIENHDYYFRELDLISI